MFDWNMNVWDMILTETSKFISSVKQLIATYICKALVLFNGRKT